MSKSFEDALKEETERIAEQLVNDDTFRLQVNQMFAEKCDPYVPYITGALATNITITPDGITYNQPYAEIVYESNNTHNQTYHPLATSRWDEVTMTDHREEIEAEVERLAEQRLKEMWDKWQIQTKIKQ